MASHIVELRSNGLSYRRIAETLNVEQIPTVRGGHRWHAQTIAGSFNVPPSKQPPDPRRLPIPRHARGVREQPGGAAKPPRTSG
jgi:hypothetical protein